MGPGLNPQPDIYAWEKPDIIAWGLQPNFVVLNVMSPDPRTGEDVYVGYTPFSPPVLVLRPLEIQSRSTRIECCSPGRNRVR